MKRILSRDNPSFRELAKLAASARSRSKAGKTLLDGAHLISSYLDSGKHPLQVFLNASALQNDEISAILSRIAEVPVVELDDKLFAELSELKTATRILALIDVPVSEPVAGKFILLLEDIQDPGNLGSMLRSAGAAGCDAVFLSQGCADAWSPRVLRAAMGGHFCIRIHEGQDLIRVAESFGGMRLAASLKADRNLYECELSGDVAIMIGNEGAGLSERLLSLSTHVVKIPMQGSVESLNAAAAAAICLFESVRQRLQTGR